MAGLRAEDPDGRLKVGYFTQDLAQVKPRKEEGLMWLWGVCMVSPCIRSTTSLLSITL